MDGLFQWNPVVFGGAGYENQRDSVLHHRNLSTLFILYCVICSYIAIQLEISKKSVESAEKRVYCFDDGSWDCAGRIHKSKTYKDISEGALIT